MTRQHLLFGAGFVCLCSSVFCAYIAMPSQAGSFGAVKEVLDLGEIGQAQTVHGEFELRNKHAKQVQIIGILESCACSNVELDSKQFEPGQKGRLKISWKTGTSRGERQLTTQVHYRFVDDCTFRENLSVRQSVNQYG